MPIIIKNLDFTNAQIEINCMLKYALESTLSHFNFPIQ